MYQKGFFFKDNLDNVRKSYTFVEDGDLYTPARGYGFVTTENMAEQEILQIPALASGFRPCGIKSERPVPTMFRVNVGHQGNYRVEIEAENDGSEAQIFLERRRMYYVGRFTGVKKFTFTANVCDIIPEGKERIYSDTAFDAAWIGEGLRIYSLDVKEVTTPTIFIAGDSTVTDQLADFPYSPGTSYSGWGQMLTAYLNEKIAVSNHAHSGLTTESFRKEGHYSIVSQYIKPGDYFFMQFGHNDQKLAHLKEDGGYRENIERYILEIRSQGAYPVIVTSLSRNTWNNSGESYNDLLSAYAEECKKIGREQNVPVIDLHEFSKNLILNNGVTGSAKYFYPGDLSHTNDYGAYVMAGFVAKEMKRIAEEAKLSAYKAFADYLITPGEWEIDPDKLIKILPDTEKEEASKDEPYKLKMDRLEEIIRSKN